MASARPYHVADGYSFLAYPNRNSVPFREYYQIPEAQTVIRGSLRSKGNPELVKALMRLGWLDTSTKDWLVPDMSWAVIQKKTIRAASTSESDLLARVDELCDFADEEERAAVLEGLRWIGLFSDNPAPVQATLLDTLSTQLQALCSFKPGERDLVMLQHKFVVEWQDGKQVREKAILHDLVGTNQHVQDTITSTLELLGEPNGDFAMSKSVGVTCGIATQMLLDRHPAIDHPGIVVPYTQELCDAIRLRVEAEGIRLVERVL